MTHVYYPDLSKKDAFGNIAVALPDGPNVDAFSRLRVSTPVGLFDSTFQYDLQPLVYYQTVANSGTITHQPNTSGARLASAAVGGSSAIMQSKPYHRYIPAKSQLIVMTQIIGVATANVVKRVGYFDANDGIFLEQNGTVDLAFVRRTSTSGGPVDNRVVQASWNLDKLDGTGPSRITLDLTKASILIVDLQWLGMGRVRVGFDVAGIIVYVHQFLNANVLAVPYMKTANLPNRWEISGSAVGSMDAQCASVISEGGTEYDRGYLFQKESAVVTAGNGTQTCIVAIRPAATLNGIVNRVQIAAEDFDGLVTGANPVLWQVVYNPTITGGSWAARDATNSAAEYNITAASISGGISVASFYTPAGAQFKTSGALEVISRMPIVLDPSGANPIAVALCATGYTGTSTVFGSMSWRELR